MMNLRPWRLSGLLTPTRTHGQVGLNRNGTMVDIWIRVDGEERRFSVNADDLAGFLAGVTSRRVLEAESDGNAE